MLRIVIITALIGAFGADAHAQVVRRSSQTTLRKGNPTTSRTRSGNIVLKRGLTDAELADYLGSSSLSSLRSDPLTEGRPYFKEGADVLFLSYKAARSVPLADILGVTEFGVHARGGVRNSRRVVQCTLSALADKTFYLNVQVGSKPETVTVTTTASLIRSPPGARTNHHVAFVIPAGVDAVLARVKDPADASVHLRGCKVTRLSSQP